MGLYDRDYTQSDYQPGHGYGPQMRMMFPPTTSAVKWLLIINVVVYVLTILSGRLANFAFEWLSVYPRTPAMSLQIWRLITYQFLHDTVGLGHILYNMIILYFLGVMLERTWGAVKFLKFYLLCGAAGGIAYPILAYIGWLDKGPLVGASGGILGVIAACALMFPNVRVLVLFIFPVRLVIVALFLAGYAVLTLIRPDKLGNAGGEAAHLGGMIAGAIYVLSQSWRLRFKSGIKHRFGQKKAANMRSVQIDLDPILDKVHREGIQSLTRREKRVLKQATELERRRNKL